MGELSRSRSMPVSRVRNIFATPSESGALIHTVSWTTAPRWLAYDATRKSASDTGLQPPLPIDTSGYESLEVKAKSADGTMVPLSIIRAKNLKLDGNRPTHLIGYGAYGLSYESYFDPVWVAWLERGGVIAFAHVRGGGEYGEKMVSGQGTSSRSSTRLTILLGVLSI